MDTLLALSEQLAAAVQRTSQSVFTVHGRSRVPSTGIHWRSGVLVTANHTVQADEDVAVVGPRGESLSATVIGRDAALDVAVLRPSVADAEVADIGVSDAVRPGHIVLAVGAGPRASWGIVSAIGAASSRLSTSDVFSLDLTLYPGFSGGPLVDARGAVIGLNTSGASRHRQLAIPAKAVTGVVDIALRHGRIPQAYLGVGTQPVRLPEAFQEREAQRTALIVVEVQAASPAAAGLLVGDILLSLDGTVVTDPLELRALLRPERIGQQVTARLIRAGRVMDVVLTIGERPARAR